MTERQQLPPWNDEDSGRAADESATILGFPADEPSAAGQPPDETGAWPVPDDVLVVVRRPDPAAGTLLLVAGTAAGLSLFLPWVAHDAALGLSLARRAAELVATGAVQVLPRSGLLLPVATVGGGAVLFLAGLAAYRPARTHRPTGVVALVVVLGVGAGVVVRVAGGGWDTVLSDPGTLCAAVVAAVGLLGSLKAMLTAPDVTTGAA